MKKEHITAILWTLIGLCVFFLYGCGGGGGGGTSPVISAPQANAGNAQVVMSGAEVTLDGSSSFDPEGATLNFYWKQISGTAVTLVSPDIATPSFTAPVLSADETATLEFQLTVNGGSRTSSDRSVVVVLGAAAVAMPVADAGPDQVVSGGAQVALNGSGSVNPGGNDLNYQWLQTGGPAVDFNDTTLVDPVFTSPNLPADTQITFSLIVSDGTNASIDAVTITVNRTVTTGSPTAAAGPDQTVFSGQRVYLDGGASVDPADLPLAFDWQEISTVGVNLAGADTPLSIFDAPTVGSLTTLTFQLTVDNGTETSVDSLVVQILPPPDLIAPTVQSISPQDGAPAVSRGASISVIFTEAMNPQTITPSSFVVSSGGVPIAGTQDYDAQNFTAIFTPAAPLGSNQEISVSLTGQIADLAGNSLTPFSWSFTTKPISAPLACVADSVVEFSFGATVTLDASCSSDAEDAFNQLQFAWSCPTLLVANAGSAVVNMIAPSQIAVETCTVTVTDTDGDSDSATALVLVLQDAAHALFVSVDGDDANPGTRALPKLTLSGALGLASSTTPRADLYVSSGNYTEGMVVMVSDVSLFGGFAPGFLAYSGDPLDNPTVIDGPSTAVNVSNLTLDTTLSGFQILAADNPAESGSSIGVHVTDSQRLILQNNRIIVGDGGNGRNGAPGLDGGTGGVGGTGLAGFVDEERQVLGGMGGTSAGTCVSRNGGNGGNGGAGVSDGQSGSSGQGSGGTPGAGGSSGNPGLQGSPGGPGFQGNSGNSGSGGNGTGSIAGGQWFPGNGSAGSDGTCGSGGGGGGGGGGQNGAFVFNGTGNGGGGGGGGGAPGTGGGGGTGGGASLGILLINSSLHASSNSITTGNGGNGGIGSPGGNGGSGGAGGLGGQVGTTEIGAGGNGGSGGRGGDGGNGGGGGGGPSVGIYQDASSQIILSGNIFNIGNGGIGGTSLSNPGQNGLSGIGN